jgi:hypothetical protein
MRVEGIPPVAGVGYRYGNQPGDFIRDEDTFLSGCFRSFPYSAERIPVQFLPGNSISHRDTHPQQYMVYAVP